MEHCDKYQRPATRLKKQQEKTTCNAFTQTKNDDTEYCTGQSSIKKPRKDPKDSIFNNSNDKTSPICMDMSKYTVNKNGEITSRDCDNKIEDIDVPTTSNGCSEYYNIVKGEKVAEFLKKLLTNGGLHKEQMEWPIILLAKPKQSIKISQKEFQNMIMMKYAEVMATKSRYAKQMDTLSEYNKKQRFWIKKFKILTKKVKSLNDELNLLKREPNSTVKHVRNVGTNVTNEWF